MLSETKESFIDAENGVGVEKPASVDNENNKECCDERKRSKRTIIAAVVLSVIVLLAIFIPVGITLKNKNDPSSSSSNTNESGTPAGNGSGLGLSSPKYFTSSEDSPFNVSMALFGESITSGYSSVDELKSDLTNAAKFMVNIVLKRNVGYRGYDNSGGGSPGATDTPLGGAEAAPAADAGTSKGVGNQVDDYGTNNQEDGVEEGGQVVSDGTYVYAGYGDYVVVWEARTGNMTSSLQMPQINMTANNNVRYGDVMPDMPIDGGFYYQPKPYVQTLLVFENRLLVIVGGYSSMKIEELNVTSGATPVLYDYLGTNVRLYDTSELASTGELVLISQTFLQGYYTAVRAINGIANIVTTSGIDSYSDLVLPFDLSNYPEDITDQAYFAAATKTAEDETIPRFVNRIIADLTDSGTRPLPDLARISLWETSVSGTGYEEIAFSEGLLNSLVQVHSLNLASNAGALEVNVGGAFLPSYWSQAYASENFMILAGQGWNIDESAGLMSDLTCLIGIDISGGSPTPRGVGNLDGYILNSYSLDVFGDILRIATTVQNYTMFLVDEPAATSSEASSKMSAQESRTQNYIITMRIPSVDSSDGIFEEVGRVQLGKPNETFTALRFFDDVAYAVTFEITDPFYVVDLSNPASLRILGEVNMTGFSSYLYDIDNTTLIAVGQEGDNQGNIIGLKINIFDVSDKANPVVAQSYVVENAPNSYIYSDSQWDFQAFRYTAGHLIIPVDYYTYDEYYNLTDEYHGFYVLEAGRDGIRKTCNVSHAPQEANANFCFYCAYLPSRAMVFDGNVMTTKLNSVRSTVIDSCEPVWSLDVTIPGNQTDGCCGVLYA